MMKGGLQPTGVSLSSLGISVVIQGGNWSEDILENLEGS